MCHVLRYDIVKREQNYIIVAQVRLTELNNAWNNGIAGERNEAMKSRKEKRKKKLQRKMEKSLMM